MAGTDAVMTCRGITLFRLEPTSAGELRWSLVRGGPFAYLTCDEATARKLCASEALQDIARSATSCWGFMAADPAVPKDERQSASVMMLVARKAINMAEGGAE